MLNARLALVLITDWSDPSEILNLIDLALKQEMQDPDRTPESEFRLVSRCRDLEKRVHALFTPPGYAALME